QPEQTTLDALADVLAGVEYHLEAARDGTALPPSVQPVMAAAFAQLADLEANRSAAEVAAAQEPGADAEESLQQESSTAPAISAASAKQSGRVNHDVPVLADELDPEILEIFIEEAGEVLETVREEY